MTASPALFESLLMALLLSSTAIAGDGAPQGWTPLQGAPSEMELRCANYSSDEWQVTLSSDQVVIAKAPPFPHIDPLPFAVPPDRARAGRRYVQKVSDGWLVGFDAGEFGGGLWWFAKDGNQSLRISPPADAPAKPEDPFRAENVRGFAEQDDQVIVLMGLDHLGGRSGRLFRVVKGRDGWALVPLALLDSSPKAWIVAGQKLLVVTDGGLWSVTPGGSVAAIRTIDLVGLYPNSMVADSTGRLYVGMRRFVLTLTESPEGWTPTWFVRTDCLRAVVKNFSCDCQQ